MCAAADAFDIRGLVGGSQHSLLDAIPKPRNSAKYAEGEQRVER
jgi:hypothetical protein